MAADGAGPFPSGAGRGPGAAAGCRRRASWEGRGAGRVQQEGEGQGEAGRGSPRRGGPLVQALRVLAAHSALPGASQQTDFDPPSRVHVGGAARRRVTVGSLEGPGGGAPV